MATAELNVAELRSKALATMACPDKIKEPALTVSIPEELTRLVFGIGHACNQARIVGQNGNGSIVERIVEEAGDGCSVNATKNASEWTVCARTLTACEYARKGIEQTVARYSQSLVLNVPKAVIGHVIGKAGKNLKRMQMEVGEAFQFVVDVGGECKIYASSEAVCQHAKAVIEESTRVHERNSEVAKQRSRIYEQKKTKTRKRGRADFDEIDSNFTPPRAYSAYVSPRTYVSRSYDSEGDDGGMLGFSASECDDLLCQGVKPWDDDADSVLGYLGGY
jgi:hypothetical protein